MSDLSFPTSPIAFNASALLSPLTGIGRYAHELAVGLQGLGAPLRYFVADRWTTQLPVTLSAAPELVLRKWVAEVPGARWLSRYRQQRGFTAGLRQQRPALYHEPNFLAFAFDGPTVITAHDASWVRHPQAHPAARVRGMNRLFPRSLAQAQRVIVDSDFVAREMVELFGVAPDKLRTVHLGVSPAFRPHAPAETAALCARWGLTPGRYVLAVGTLEPRKNLKLLLEAYRRLPADWTLRHPLVVAGRTGWAHADVDKGLQALEQSGRLRLLGHVAEAELPALYAASGLFVYPSIYEGFGLPPLEAMASGVPVIVADRASLPEVVGEAGLRIHPDDADALAEHMQQVLGDGALHQRMAAAGLAQAAGFTWQRCAAQTLDVYRELLPC